VVIDVHSHIYLPRYVEILRGRDRLPRIVIEGGGERLLILPEEERGGGLRGRPIDPEYSQVDLKLERMDRCGIDAAVLSPANPWLDFADRERAAGWAQELNQDLEEVCAAHPTRFCGLGVLGFHDLSRAIEELERIARRSRLRGVMIGTSAAGRALDDPVLEPVWKRASDLGLVIYIHPHYGIGTETFGEHAYTLNFALGFPFETSIAAARLVLSGILERFPELKIVLAHAGGTLPYLSGRLDGCASSYSSRLPRPPGEYLRRLYYDVTAFHAPAVRCALEFAGPSHLMFGTDHPFRKDPSEVYRSLDGLDITDQEWIREKTARALFRI
jgi:aminocarboxymuconate-semialdehyde decarboxylase